MLQWKKRTGEPSSSPKAPPWPEQHKEKATKMTPIFKVAKLNITDAQGYRRVAYFVRVNPDVVNPVARLDENGVVNESVTIDSINRATFPKFQPRDEWQSPGGQWD